ncbi:hypothetical protein NPIL_462571, partial [Nephila pilipes]
EGLLCRHGGTVCRSPDSAIGGNESSHQREKTDGQCRRTFSSVCGHFEQRNTRLRGRNAEDVPEKHGLK